ncbi:MAG: hypothetical protein NVS3B5_22730 [Sphingomicrobium sp.]
MLRLTIVLTVTYTLAVAIRGNGQMAEKLIGEALFAGPMVIGCIMSIGFSGAKPRLILLCFAIAYSTMSALTFVWTFGFERDAQYQLILLLIPALGFPSVGVFGLAAATNR